MPIILTVDGPSLGGFVCPATTIAAHMHKWGQVKPGDEIAFEMTSLQDAAQCRAVQDAQCAYILERARGAVSAENVPELIGSSPWSNAWPETAAVVHRTDASICRIAGDRYVFVEFGEMVLDFNVRARVAELEKWFVAKDVAGVIETSPGVRSCMIEYDARVLPLPALLAHIASAEADCPDVSQLKIRSRVLKLPMAFAESKSKDAMAKYAQSVRPEATYLPDNVPFVAENNGLSGVEELKKIVFDASYLVMGLGDVYLGAPCAVPADPLHRLTTPKYNPARTFTWEGTVGLGGAYMCIYSMNSPGGYQLIGRTLPVWDSFGSAHGFDPAKPWLLEIFDQIRYHEVTEPELDRLRAEVDTGIYTFDISEEEFDMAEHNAYCESITPQVKEWTQQQAVAEAKMQVKDAEILARLEASGYTAGAGMGAGAETEVDDMAAFQGAQYTKVVAPYAACVWAISCEEGARVAEGDQLYTLEAMKMESMVVAPVAGLVVKIIARKGQLVHRSSVLLVIDTSDAA